MTSLASVNITPDGKYVFSQSTSPEEIQKNGGGKAANLAFLSAIKSTNVPAWGFVSQIVFRKSFLDPHSSLFPEIQTLNSACQSPNPDMSKIFDSAHKVRQSIEKNDLDPQEIEALHALYTHISANGTLPVAVRSSATTEDAREASFAGQYDSVLNQRNFIDFLHAIRFVWASTFSNRSIQYQVEKKMDLNNSSMGVIVQQMIQPKSSGTAFTVDVATGYPGINIVTNFGVEGVVGGEPGDSYLLTKELVPIRRTIVPKTTTHQMTANQSGVKELAVQHTEASISTRDAEHVARVLQEIADRYFSIYPGAIDTEFCITDDGHIHFLQVRPVTNVSAKLVYDLDPSFPASKMQTIADGKYAVFGVSQGRIKVITRFDQLLSGEVTVEPEDIIVAHRTENAWSQFFKHFKGIITMEGNPTAHPMLVAREHGVPCVIGVKDAVDTFLPYNGQKVTIDGFRKKVYLGEIPLVQVPLSKISEMFETVKPEKLPNVTELVSEARKKGKMIVDQIGDVWFVKPDSVLSGSLLELQLASFPVRAGLINRTGATPSISIDGLQQVIGGKVYEKLLGSLQEQVALLNRVTVEQFETYMQQEADAMKSYLSSCQNFDLTVDKWHAFCDAYRDMCAYMWLSFITRTSKLDRMYEMAAHLGIPKIYYAECEATIQATTFEEDIAFKQDMNKLQSTLLQHYTKEELKSLSIDMLRTSQPNLYREIVALSRHYKFTSSADWKMEIQPSMVLKRIINTELSFDIPPSNTNVSDFFVGHPELLRWTILGTKSKVQQNNAHHQRVRGHWFVRDKLIALGQKILNQASEQITFEALNETGAHVRRLFVKPTDILDATTEQVETFIKQLE